MTVSFLLLIISNIIFLWIILFSYCDKNNKYVGLIFILGIVTIIIYIVSHIYFWKADNFVCIYYMNKDIRESGISLPSDISKSLKIINNFYYWAYIGHGALYGIPVLVIVFSILGSIIGSIGTFIHALFDNNDLIL